MPIELSSVIGEIAQSNTLLEFIRYAYAPQLVSDGITSFSLDLPLTRNAVIKQFDVIVQARPAAGVVAANVAQVRANASTQDYGPSQGMAIVLDFGTPRTVSAVQVPNGLSIAKVTAWIGTGFAPTPAYSAMLASIATGPNAGKTSLTPRKGSSATVALLSSEIRTERLLVDVIGQADASSLGGQMIVVLPEAPSDLELRIDGGTPVFRSPGPVQLSPDVARTTSGWNKDGDRIVPLGEALAALTGDPTRPEPVTFRAVLTSRVPGVLKISRGGPGTELVLYVRRARFGADTSRELAFAEEGVLDVPLELGAPGMDPAARISEVSFTTLGTLPPERVVPPIGPDDGGIADLVVTAARAALVRVPAASGLAELTGVRLPLRAGAGGAEVRVALWSNATAGADAPAEAIPQAVSAPITLPAAASAAWQTFAFARAVKLDDDNTPWAALLVARGEVSSPLGVGVGSGLGAVRTGAPAGPWLPLPRPFVDGSSLLGSVRGRLRVIGHAPRDTPLAPLVVALAGSTGVPATPTQKGATGKVEVVGGTPVAGASLIVTSRATGTVTLRDVDVVSSG